VFSFLEEGKGDEGAEKCTSAAGAKRKEFPGKIDGMGFELMAYCISRGTRFANNSFGGKVQPEKNQKQKDYKQTYIDPAGFSGSMDGKHDGHYTVVLNLVQVITFPKDQKIPIFDLLKDA
jgi:hypothetical protein